MANLPVMLVEWRVGDVIRRLRLTAQWGLIELATEAGVAFQTINKIELGKTKDPRGRTLIGIASAFGLTERQLRNAVPEPMDRARTIGLQLADRSQ